MSIILGIDPGPKQSAIVKFAARAQTVLAKAMYQNDELICRLKGEYSFSYAIIEKIILYKRVGSEVADTLMFIGELKATLGKKAILIPRITIRNHFCGIWKANDQGIKKALTARYGKLDLNLHQIQALALAVYFTDTYKGEDLEEIGDD